MKKTEITGGAGRLFARISFKLKKHSPEILVAAGIAGTVVSAVLACKATTKISKVLDKAKEEIETINNCADDETMTEEYTQEDAKKDTAVVYIQTGIKLARLYAPAVILGTLSLGSIISSTRILRRRNLALAAAYATIDKGFKEYRGRVSARFGEEIDKELKYNIKTKKFDETVVDENGKEKNVKTAVNVAELDMHSDYARFFDESSTCWEKDAEYNLMFLRSRQQYANDLLICNGHLFLNEVYDMLGIPRTKAGQIVGWVYNKERPTGDNYVDFGIYDTNREVVRDFVNGYERSILLDFNVDGNILDLV